MYYGRRDIHGTEEGDDALLSGHLFIGTFHMMSFEHHVEDISIFVSFFFPFSHTI